LKTLGIVGGIGPESTLDYYRLIIEAYTLRRPDGSYPPLIINSIDLKRVVALLEAGELSALTDHLLEEIRKLAHARADFGLLAANTPHIVFDELQRRSPIPLLSIVEATCDKAKSLGFERIALFGTRFTMQAQFYPDVFARNGMTIVLPERQEQEYIHEKYMRELIRGIFLHETRAELLAIIDRLQREHSIQAVILGGTELPLILSEDAHEGLAFLNTTKIHVEAAVAMIFAKD
jgi:aspartate racemase